MFRSFNIGPHRAMAVIWACSVLSGCLYTHHHFSTGRIADPGETQVTVGVGKRLQYDLYCPESYWMDEEKDGKDICTQTSYVDTGGGYANTSDTLAGGPLAKRSAFPAVSLDYRLGVRRDWGPLTGVEIGWHLEAYTNPITAEFDLKLGLPVPDRSIWIHSAGFGWGIGVWTDNSYFAEYALGVPWGNHRLFGNARLTWLATQPQYLEEQGADLISGFANKNFLVGQMSFGMFGRLPQWPLLPDYIIPQIHLVLDPHYLSFSGAGTTHQAVAEWNANFGMGWDFH